MPIAQLRYDGDGRWTLYFGDRNGKWVLYFDLDPRQPIDVLIDELRDDPTCIFWGSARRAVERSTITTPRNTSPPAGAGSSREMRACVRGLRRMSDLVRDRW